MSKERDRRLRKTYGITLQGYETMVAKQGGACFICQRKPEPGKVLCVDHDHRVGNVRGALCFFCNKYLIGRRRTEHAELFHRAAAYLRMNNDHRDVPHERTPKERRPGKRRRSGRAVAARARR